MYSPDFGSAAFACAPADMLNIAVAMMAMKAEAATIEK